MRTYAWILLGTLVARASGDVVDYDNTTGFFQRAFPAGLEIADDVHRVSSADIIAIDIAYYAFEAGGRNLRLRFYENEGIGGPFPAPLISEYEFGNLPGEIGEHRIRLDLPSALTAPQDLWVGFLFDPSASILEYWPPTIGTSNDYFLRDNDLDGSAESLMDTEALDDFYLRIHTVPEPAVPGMVLLASLLCRKRQLQGAHR